jgi:hypothetical protein
LIFTVNPANQVLLRNLISNKGFEFKMPVEMDRHFVNYLIIVATPFVNFVITGINGTNSVLVPIWFSIRIPHRNGININGLTLSHVCGRLCESFLSEHNSVIHDIAACPPATTNPQAPTINAACATAHSPKYAAAKLFLWV